MLLDSFHPTRSGRYHTRRYAFIRKIKCSNTPTRYATHLSGKGFKDEEEEEAFDEAEAWVRGEEWGWVGMEAPKSMDTSEITRINLFPQDERIPASPSMSLESWKADYATSRPSSPVEYTYEKISIGSPYRPSQGRIGETRYESDKSISTILGDGPTTPSTGGRIISDQFDGKESVGGVRWLPNVTPSKQRGGRVMETPKSPSPKSKVAIKGYSHVKPTLGGMVEVEFPCLYSAGDGVGGE